MTNTNKDWREEFIEALKEGSIMKDKTQQIIRFIEKVESDTIERCYKEVALTPIVIDSGEEETGFHLGASWMRHSAFMMLRILWKQSMGQLSDAEANLERLDWSVRSPEALKNKKDE